MTALVIFISSDVSVESVRSSFLRVILIGSISVEVPVAPEVGAAALASPAVVLELDTHSSSEADPSGKIPTAPILPALSAIVAPSSEFPLAPVVALPRIHRQRSILIRLEEDIPIGRLYRTHPNGPCRELTARKSVRPLHSYRLALRYTSHHLDHFTSGSSSSHSSLDHSSSRHSSSGHSLSRHTPPDTTDADSSTPSRFVHPPLARTPWCSEAYLYWRSALLSTMYPPTISESSARPSRKICRSSTATVTSSIHATRALVLSRDIEVDAMAVEVIVDRDVKPGVDTGIDMEIDVEVDVEDEVEDKHVMEIPLQRIEDIKMGQRELEARSMIVGRERASLLN
nr:hypothetical protein [Tanacetum cinerariifolium]